MGANHVLKSSFGRSRGQYLFKVEKYVVHLYGNMAWGADMGSDDSIDSNASRNLSGSLAFHQHVQIQKQIKWGGLTVAGSLKG